MRSLLLAVALVAPVVAQQPAFKSGVQTVTVPITVTNAARDKLIVAGLQPTDFRLTEDGVEQRITLFTHERPRVSICFVVDASGSMAEDRRLERGIRALQHTVRGLEAGDEISIVRFANAAITVVPWTSGPDLSRVSWPLEPGAGLTANSSVRDGVREALKEIERAANPKAAIVVISDGYDNASVTPMWRLARTRQQSEALVYAFGVGGPQERTRIGPLPNILPAVVGETGGVYWNVSSMTDAEFAAMSLLNELKHQMTLGYTPAKPFDGKYRRIKVETTVKDLAVRHRGGYLALAPGDQK